MADIEQIELLLKRIKLSDDGPQFVDYLRALSEENYLMWKKSTGEDVFIKQGYAIAIDSLIQSFANCSVEKVNEQSLFPNWGQ